MANADLFGHKKGAFTGADKDRNGKFVEANGGILFLDELAELPPEVQAKLLRVIEDGRVTPVGADQYETEVDVLILAATDSELSTHTQVRGLSHALSRTTPLLWTLLKSACHNAAATRR